MSVYFSKRTTYFAKDGIAYVKDRIFYAETVYFKAMTIYFQPGPYTFKDERDCAKVLTLPHMHPKLKNLSNSKLFD